MLMLFLVALDVRQGRHLLTCYLAGSIRCVCVCVFSHEVFILTKSNFTRTHITVRKERKRKERKGKKGRICRYDRNRKNIRIVDMYECDIYHTVTLPY